MKLGRVIDRFDGLPIGGFRVDQDGFGRGVIRFTRDGVFVYRNADGSIRRELRHREDVLDPESVASAQQLTITRGHPTDESGRRILVTANNHDQWAVGEGSETVRTVEDGPWVHLETGVKVFRGDVSKSILGGRNQASSGYRLQLEPVSGTYKGRRYDVRQRNIRYNHIAVDIDAGRAGTAEVRLDADDAILVGEADIDNRGDEDPTQTKGPQIMFTVDLGGGASINFDDKDAQKGMMVKSRFDDVVKARDEATEKLKEAEESAQAEKARADAAEDKLKKLEKSNADEAGKLGPKEVAERLSILSKCSSLGMEINTDSAEGLGEALAKNPNELRRLAVVSALGDQFKDTKEYPDVYIRGRFDQLEVNEDEDEDDRADEDEDDAKKSNVRSFGRAAARADSKSKTKGDPGFKRFASRINKILDAG